MWLLIFVSTIIFTVNGGGLIPENKLNYLSFQIVMVVICYKYSNWYNIKDIQDYDGTGMIYVAQMAFKYWENILIAMGAATGKIIMHVLIKCIR